MVEDSPPEETDDGFHCPVCPLEIDDDMGEIQSERYSTDEEWWEHYEEDHPELPSGEELEETANEFLTELVEITNRLDEMVEEYWELPNFARKLQVKDEIECAANRTGRASWELDRQISGDSDAN